MRNRRGLAFIAAGLALILAACGLTAYNMVDEQKAGENVARALEQLIPKTIEPGRLELPENILPAYEVDPRVEMPLVEIGGHAYIGYVDFPTLDLNLPVMSEWSYPKMKIAPCRYWGSVYMDNMVIAAHNYVNHFGKLGNLSAGDPVTFTDVEGNVFEYTVSDMVQLWPNQARDMVMGDDWDLTLFTCTRSGRQRLTVRCVRVDESGE